MVGGWKKLLDLTVAGDNFTGVQTKTSRAHLNHGASVIQYEFTSDGAGAAVLSSITPLYDPTPSDSTADLLSVAGTQANAPLASLLANTIAFNFDDVVGKVLSTAPLYGYALYTTNVGILVAEGVGPLRALYLQCVSSADLKATIRARCIGTTSDTVSGSVV